MNKGLHSWILLHPTFHSTCPRLHIGISLRNHSERTISTQVWQDGNSPRYTLTSNEDNIMPLKLQAAMQNLIGSNGVGCISEDSTSETQSVCGEEVTEMHRKRHDLLSAHSSSPGHETFQLSSPDFDCDFADNMSSLDELLEASDNNLIAELQLQVPDLAGPTLSSTPTHMSSPDLTSELLVEIRLAERGHFAHLEGMVDFGSSPAEACLKKQLCTAQHGLEPSAEQSCEEDSCSHQNVDIITTDATNHELLNEASTEHCGSQYEVLAEAFFPNEDVLQDAFHGDQLTGEIVSLQCLQAEAKSSEVESDSADLKSFSDVVKDIEHVLSRRPGRKRVIAKNLASERKRRQKLNDRLYALRAIVPNISKMDKASIVADAIQYVRDLQRQAEDLEADISKLQAEATLADEDPTQTPVPVFSIISETVRGGSDSEHTSGNNFSIDSTDNAISKAPCKPIMSSLSTPGAMNNRKDVQVEVSRIEKQMYHLHFTFSEWEDALCELLRGLNTLSVDIMSVSFSRHPSHSHINVLTKIKGWDELSSSQVEKEMQDLIHA